MSVTYVLVQCQDLGFGEDEGIMCLWRIRGLSLHSGLDIGKLSKMPAFSRLRIPYL